MLSYLQRSLWKFLWLVYFFLNILWIGLSYFHPRKEKLHSVGYLVFASYNLFTGREINFFTILYFSHSLLSMFLVKNDARFISFSNKFIIKKFFFPFLKKSTLCNNYELPSIVFFNKQINVLNLTFLIHTTFPPS